MELPQKLTFVEGYYFTDGGSIVLLADEPDGTRRQITLGQHRFLEVFDPNVLPGRLYLDHQLVPVRSALESEVLALLNSGAVLPAESRDAEKSAPAAGGPVVILGDDLKDYYAKVAEGKRETIRHLIQQVVDFVGSRKYVRIANRIDKKISGENE